MARIALCLAVALLPCSVVARHQGPVKLEDVLRVLKYYTDPRPADFAQAGSQVDSVLAELVVEPRADEEVRCRAARALGRFGGTRAVRVLVATMSAPDYPERVRAAAMVGLALASGEAALEDVKPYLKGPSAVLRIGAAEALGVMGGERARVLLTASMESEDVLEVRAAMEAALKAMRGGTR